MSNIVFCKPGAVVLEIFSPDYVNPCYWHLAQHLPVRYCQLSGTGVPEPLDEDALWCEANVGRDIEVDPELLRIALDSLPHR
jgi:hypothetical protein